MKKVYGIIFLGWIITAPITVAQTAPFSGSWGFEGNDNGTSSNPLVAVSSVSYVGVNKLFNNYFSGYVGLGVSLQHWSTTGCDYTEYAQFSIQPQGTAQVTLTALSFAFSRSDDGPQQLTVRSSIDGFSSDIYSQSVSLNYQIASVTLNGSGFINQTSTITFRIYGCNPISSNGTLRLDEIQINATVLPVTLLDFSAKPEGDRVQLAWETATERDADRFVIERSHDLGEYVSVGEVAAKGNTDERQNYGLTDLNPQLGVNYYRLTQIDSDGTRHAFKPISAMIDVDVPVVEVFPNPATTDRIHLRLWNADDAMIQLRTTSGQTITGRLERQAGEADFIVDQPLSPGLYWLDVQTNEQKKVIKVLVR